MLSESVRHPSNLPRSETSGSPQIGKRDCIRRDLTPLSATRQEGFRASRKGRSERLGTTKFATRAEYSIIRRSEGFHPGKIVDHKGRVMDARERGVRISSNHRTKAYQSFNHQKKLNHVGHHRNDQLAHPSDGACLPLSHATSWRSGSFVLR